MQQHKAHVAMAIFDDQGETGETRKKGVLVTKPLRRTTPSPGSSPNKGGPQSPRTPKNENQPPPPLRSIPATPPQPSTPPRSGTTPQNSPTSVQPAQCFPATSPATSPTGPSRPSRSPKPAPQRTPPSSPQNAHNQQSSQQNSPLSRPGVTSSPRHLSIPPAAVTTSQRKRIVVSMRTFWARLSTFNDWKRARPNPQNLSLSGFYFSGNVKNPQRPGDMDKTTCFSCGLTFVNWYGFYRLLDVNNSSPNPPTTITGNLVMTHGLCMSSTIELTERTVHL